jgi:uncharacterized protein YukE
MQKAVADIVDAKGIVDGHISKIQATSEGTLKAWGGAGGDTLRSLMVKYDLQAKKLQREVDIFQQMINDQARGYATVDVDASTVINQAGSGVNSGFAI